MDEGGKRPLSCCLLEIYIVGCSYGIAMIKHNAKYRALLTHLGSSYYYTTYFPPIIHLFDDANGAEDQNTSGTSNLLVIVPLLLCRV